MIAQPAFWVVLGAMALAVRLAPRRWRWWPVVVGSGGLLAALAPLSVAVLLAWAVLVYRGTASAGHERRVPVRFAMVVGLLSTLAAFKYVPPLVTAVVGAGPTGAVAVPLGISYYTFKLVHWVVESGRGGFATRSVDRYLAWLLLLPSFAAGPIEPYDHFEEHLEAPPRLDGVAEGLIRIAHGLIKKLLLADGLLVAALGGLDVASVVADPASASPATIWRLLVLGYLRTYLDFSAYTDIAVGGGRLLGVRLVENFRWPILATDLGDFWRRWHMSLVAWCQRYVYLPTVGWSRNPYLATVATFLVMGAWHAGSLHWIAWGAYHSVGVIVFRWWSRRRRGAARSAAGRIAGWVLTQGFVAAGGAFTMLYGVAPAVRGLSILRAALGLP